MINEIKENLPISFKNCRINKISSGASNKKYYRLNKNNQNAILMDSSKEPKQFENFLKYVNSGHLIMVHPGYVSKKFHLSDKVNESREEEYKFLKSDDYLNLLEKNKCLLAPLSSILKILDNE